jgi:hypothetical protein
VETSTSSVEVLLLLLLLLMATQEDNHDQLATIVKTNKNNTILFEKEEESMEPVSVRLLEVEEEADDAVLYKDSINVFGLCRINRCLCQRACLMALVVSASE